MRYGIALCALALGLAAMVVASRPHASALSAAATPDSLASGQLYQFGTLAHAGDSALVCMAGHTRSGRPAVMEPAMVLRLRPNGDIEWHERPGALSLCGPPLRTEGLDPEIAVRGRWHIGQADARAQS